MLIGIQPPRGIEEESVLSEGIKFLYIKRYTE